MKLKIYPILAALAILAMVVVPASARPAKIESASELSANLRVITPKISNIVMNEEKNAAGPALYTVLLREASLASYDGSLPGLKATSPSVTGAARLDAKSVDSLAYRSYLAENQARFIKALETQFSRKIDIKQTYQVVLNGFAAVLTPTEAATIALRSDVRMVERSGLNQVDTDAGPSWIGAPGIWDGSDTGGVLTQGEGVVVGILDSGINSDHPSFAEVGPLDGYVHVNPLGDGVYVGVCDPADPSYDASFVCNDKLIGGWEFAYDYITSADFDYPTPEDEDGHGSHTSSTTAGNKVSATLYAPTTNLTRPISGVAPRANIIIYDVCHTGGCPFVSTTAAAEQAVIDGVDVINYSISGGEDPYHESTDLAFLEAYNAGVFVSTSAGNNGPTSDTVAHRGPWVSASAAATHNRVLFNHLVDLTSDGTTLPDITGLGFTTGLPSAPIVYAGDYGDALCPLGEFLPGTFNGEIVVCDRGTHARLDKAQSVADGGAGGFVLANDALSGTSLVGDAYAIPGLHITYTDGVALKAWIASQTNTVAAITGFEEDLSPVNADILASFSSRGPNTTFDVVKPDLTNPGVDIWAAILTPDLANPGPAEYGFMSGTSMASPHTAGAAALMTALHPEWSSTEILSALMMTADSTVLREDAATAADAHDMGAGRVDLSLAAKTGLVLDETYANYVAANPDLGGEPNTLNQPSMMESACIGTCSWTRTFKSTLAVAQEWQVSYEPADPDMVLVANPVNFTLAAGAVLPVVFSADLSAASPDTYYFGNFVLTPLGSPDVPVLHLPVVAMLGASNLPIQLDILTDQQPGSVTLQDIQSSYDITDMHVVVSGLKEGSYNDLSLSQDPTNGDPFDSLSQVSTTILQVPGGTMRLVAEVVASEAPDVDLYMGSGNKPSAATLLCSSASGIWAEYCNLDHPTSGQYWVLLQNWQGSTDQPDAIRLVTAIVGEADLGNMSVTYDNPVVPNSHAFDLAVNWDEASLASGDYWYAQFSLGTDPAQPGNLGYTNVDLEFLAQVLAMDLAPDTQDGFGDPETIVAHNLSLANDGNYADTYALTVTGNTWVTTLSVPSISLAAGASANFIVNVTIPANALAGASDTVTVTAKSNTDAAVIESVLANTYANTVYTLDLFPATDADSGAPDDVITYSLTLQNLGNSEDTVTLSFADNLWAVNLPQTSFTLAAGASTTVTVEVTIPADAVNASADSVTITATSEGGTDVTSVLTTTAVVPVDYQMLWMPIIINTIP